MLPTIVLTDRLDQLLAPPRQFESDLDTVLQRCKERQFTGPVTLHYHLGTLKVIELPPPQIRVATGNGA